ncbi:MAG: M23 family metallopeptidase [Bacillota bacterium]|nr:M23 family metallopeptidase [Clostridia bacterium]
MPGKGSLRYFFNKKWVRQTIISILLAVLVCSLTQSGDGLGYWVRRQVVSALSVENDWMPEIQEVIGWGAKKEYYPLVLPVSGIVVKNYGWCSGDRKDEKIWHEGIDIKTEIGQPVKAAAEGMVEKINNDKGQGNLIIIKHQRNLRTIYQNIEAVNLKQGQEVKQGERLGVTGVHPVHFEIHVRGSAVDPLEYLRGNSNSI